MSALYKGFSSVGKSDFDTTLTDIELIKQDLLNNLNTRRGERVGRPLYGSIIPELVGDLFRADVESLIQQDVNRIVDGDPRVKLSSLQIGIDPLAHSIHIRMNLHVLELSMDTVFDVAFS